MKNRRLLGKLLNFYGLSVQRYDLQRTRSFLEMLGSHYVNIDLVRIGPKGDGGYLLPDILHKIDVCFSPGVSDNSEFEKELSERFQIPAFMADASVDMPAAKSENFTFTKKFLGIHDVGEFMTLSSWLEQSNVEGNNLLLQMDIEGAEFDVLAYEDITVIERFAVLIIEFHGLERLLNPLFVSAIEVTFVKLLNKYAIAHIHPNNCCGSRIYQDVELPSVCEITFVRKDFLEDIDINSEITFPHQLDFKNNPELPDIILPDLWRPENSFCK